MADGTIDLVELEERPSDSTQAFEVDEELLWVGSEPAHQTLIGPRCALAAILRFPRLKGILDESRTRGWGLVIAGGAASGWCQSGEFPSDIDCFFYGVAEDRRTDFLVECLEAAKGDLEDLVAETRPRLSPSWMVVQFSKYSATVKSSLSQEHPELIPIQFVLRAHESRAQILEQFDLVCSQVLFDGEKLWATPAAASSFEFKVFEYDQDRHGTAHVQRRVIKYAQRGWNILVPRFILEASRLIRVIRRDEPEVDEFHEILPELVVSKLGDDYRVYHYREEQNSFLSAVGARAAEESAYAIARPPTDSMRDPTVLTSKLEPNYVAWMSYINHRQWNAGKRSVTDFFRWSTYRLGPPGAHPRAEPSLDYVTKHIYPKIGTLEDSYSFDDSSDRRDASRELFDYFREQIGDRPIEIDWEWSWRHED